MEYLYMVSYEVVYKKKIARGLRKLPANVQERFFALVDILEAQGPTGGRIFLNYSKLSDNEYHCHLTYHYVACWRHEGNNITIEVYYVGSREGAPY
jgi:mRNA-degrading endonuclease RelE of RelBE toxin-antitoxin system